MKLTRHLIAIGIAIAAVVTVTPYSEDYRESGFGSRSWNNYAVRLALSYYVPFKPQNQVEIVHIAPGLTRTEAFTIRLAWEILIPGILVIYGVSVWLLGRRIRQKAKGNITAASL